MRPNAVPRAAGRLANRQFAVHAVAVQSEPKFVPSGPDAAAGYRFLRWLYGWFQRMGT